LQFLPIFFLSWGNGEIDCAASKLCHSPCVLNSATARCEGGFVPDSCSKAPVCMSHIDCGLKSHGENVPFKCTFPCRQTPNGECVLSYTWTHEWGFCDTNKGIYPKNATCTDLGHFSCVHAWTNGCEWDSERICCRAGKTPCVAGAGKRESCAPYGACEAHTHTHTHFK